MDELVFASPEPIKIPVTIGTTKYELREASESAASRYKDAQLLAMKTTEGVDGKKISIVEKMNETEALLVSLCLFELTENGGFKTVPIDIIRGWVHRIVTPLFEKAEEISNLKRKNTPELLKKRIKELQDELSKLDNGHSIEEETKK